MLTKINVLPHRGFILATLYSKDARQKLVFTVAVLLKGNRSSFSKQLGINCTCEQIELFLISTSGCGSHSWKLLKSPICSRVQSIPNCFSNRPIPIRIGRHDVLLPINQNYDKIRETNKASIER